MDRGPGSHQPVLALGAGASSSTLTTRCPVAPRTLFRRQLQRARVGEPHPGGEPRDPHEVIDGTQPRCGTFRRKYRRALALETVDDDACRWVLDGFTRANIAVKVWDTTSDVGIASFNCLVLGRDDDSGRPGVRRGVPSRLGSVALLRALTEAAQAPHLVAGSRDGSRAADITRRSALAGLRDRARH